MSILPAVGSPSRLEGIFERYHQGWLARDPNRIASLHSNDTTFWFHDGTPPLQGRAALRFYCVQMFSRYQFENQQRRVLFGQAHWVLEWTMVVSLQDTAGQPFEARVEMLDVVDVNDAGEVTRKDVYMNGAQAQAAFRRAGISIDEGIK